MLETTKQFVVKDGKYFETEFPNEFYDEVFNMYEENGFEIYQTREAAIRESTRNKRDSALNK